MECTKLYHTRSEKEIATDYFEVPYVEYRDGRRYCTGTEDFSTARIRMLKNISYEAQIHKGRMNKAGHKMRETATTLGGQCMPNQEAAARKNLIKHLKETHKNQDVRIVKLH